MRFVLYSDKTISQCVSALTERLQAPAAANRPALGGWVEKGGHFSISMKSVVLGTFTRTTRLEGSILRESGSTVIRGSVPDGVPPKGQLIILLAILAVGILIVIQGKALLGVIAMIASVAVYVPLRGDYENSDRLLLELERTLKADPKPPKSKQSNGNGGVKKPAAAAPKKPAGPAVKKTQTTTVKRPAVATTSAAKKSTVTTTAKKPTTSTAKKPVTPAAKKPTVPAKKPAPTARTVPVR